MDRNRAVRLFVSAAVLSLLSAPTFAQTVTTGDATWSIANGRGPSLSDAVIPSTGQTDAFDDGGIVRVNGATLPSQAPAKSVTGAGTFFTTAVGSLSGVNVQTQFFLSNTNRVARVYTTFTNPGATTISFTATYETNFGSDGNTQIIATSSGDGVIDGNDRFVISDDGSLTAGDPANTTVLYGPGASLLPASVFNSTTFINSGTQGVRADFLMTLSAGETAGLIFFQQLNTTAANAVASASTFNSFGSMESAGYFAGLSQGQIATVRNLGGNVAVVPEAGTAALFGPGALTFVGMVARRLRKRN